jgi:hypothetical protein
MEIDSFDSLVISLLDSDAMKGAFMKELAKMLNLPVICISEIWMETKLTGGVATQYVVVAFIDAEIKKEDLMKLPFHSIYENTIRFKVGDTIL